TRTRQSGISHRHRSDRRTFTLGRSPEGYLLLDAIHQWELWQRAGPRSHSKPVALPAGAARADALADRRPEHLFLLLRWEPMAGQLGIKHFHLLSAQGPP